MPVPGVMGFGALNMDKVMFVDKIPGPDREGYATSVEWHPGGSAPNTIVGLSRLGVRSGCLGRVGRDAEGSAIMDSLSRERVETSAIRKVDGRSGTAMVVVDARGQRAILIDPGVNDSVSREDIDFEYLRTFDLIHMSSFVCRSETTSFETQLNISRELDVPISLDPGQLYAERGLRELEPLVRRSRIVMPNENELRLLTSLGPKGGSRKLLSAGAEIVVVKRGLEGSYVTDGRVEGAVPAYGGRGVDTTGAGDAFNAGFIYGVLEGRDILECAELGAKVAFFSLQKPGARDGLPSLDQILSLS